MTDTLHRSDLAAEARAVLADLVAFDTTSRNANLALIDYAEARLQAAGAWTQRIPSPDGRKSNLWARIGPDAPGGVILSGHTDVVPVDGQDWSSDPFALTERSGRLYGRGTCDMKGFVALALAAAEDFAAKDLARPVHYALSYDEEVGCLGAPAMIDVIARDGPPIHAVIIGEPTEMSVVSGHKGLLSFEITLRGAEAHSSMPEAGACAVTHAVPLMGWVVDQAAAWEAAAPADSPFDPPHGTMTIGRMSGGTALNILAKSASFGLLARSAPWDDAAAFEAGLREKAAEVEAQMRKTAPNASVVVERCSNVPPMRPEVNGAAEELARALTGDNALRVAAYGAEGGQFQEGGFSTVICGPGSIAQAHQPDEFISLDQLAKGADFLTALAERMTRPA